jgi:hypothetical protein
MAEKTAAEYAAEVSFQIEPDFYKSRLIAYEFVDGEGRFDDKGKPFMDSYKLIWEIPDAEQTEFWDFVPARFGVRGNDGTLFALQATVDALTGAKVDMTSPEYADVLPSTLLNDLVGKQMELYIEPIKNKSGKITNKVTKRRPLKATKEK